MFASFARSSSSPSFVKSFVNIMVNIMVDRQEGKKNLAPTLAQVTLQPYPAMQDPFRALAQKKRAARKGGLAHTHAHQVLHAINVVPKQSRFRGEVQWLTVGSRIESLA